MVAVMDSRKLSIRNWMSVFRIEALARQVSAAIQRFFMFSRDRRAEAGHMDKA